MTTSTTVKLHHSLETDLAGIPVVIEYYTLIHASGTIEVNIEYATAFGAFIDLHRQVNNDAIGSYLSDLVFAAITEKAKS